MSITPTAETKQSTQKPLKNRFNRSEWAGAFGDLGTLIPFIIGYISIMNCRFFTLEHGYWLYCWTSYARNVKEKDI